MKATELYNPEIRAVLRAVRRASSMLDGWSLDAESMPEAEPADYRRDAAELARYLRHAASVIDCGVVASQEAGK